MRSYTQLVPHCSADNQQGRRKACEVDDEGLQVGRVFVIEENVVTESCAFDGCKHRWGGACRYIAFEDFSLRAGQKSRGVFRIERKAYCGSRTLRILGLTRPRANRRRH